MHRYKLSILCVILFSFTQIGGNFNCCPSNRGCDMDRPQDCDLLVVTVAQGRCVEIVVSCHLDIESINDVLALGFGRGLFTLFRAGEEGGRPIRDRKGVVIVADPCFPPLPYGRGSD